MCRTGNVKLKLKNIEKKAGIQNNGLFKSKVNFNLINPGWGYTENSKAVCPFPCNPFYDKKAWEWLINNEFKLKSPILFWNIGK